ncbi:MAG: hypothetical protein AAF320_06705 [Myxococcota bacterium]
MEKFFNTSGPLNTAEHYILDLLQRWDLLEVPACIAKKKRLCLC